MLSSRHGPRPCCAEAWQDPEAAARIFEAWGDRSAVAGTNGLIKGIPDVRGYFPKQTACSYSMPTPFHPISVLAADLDENTADADE